MNAPLLRPAVCLIFITMTACAQVAHLPPGSKTFSPYSPQQIKEFNGQTLSPVEGPFGPMDLRVEDARIAKERAADTKLYNQPQGEEEAQALETQSADPYQATKPVFTF